MERATARNKFELEALEPRVLLSVEVMGPCLPAPDPAAEFDAAEVIEEEEFADDLGADGALAYDTAAQLDDIFGATSDDSGDEETSNSINKTQPQIFGPDPVENPSAVPSEPEILSGGPADAAPPASITEQLTDTLRAANGPPFVLRTEDTGFALPNLPGLQIIGSDLQTWRGQVVYLDVDGEMGITYSGAITLGGIDLPVFKAPSSLAGQEQAIMSSVLDSLCNTFAGTGVNFTLKQPGEGTSYSTIYVGGDDSAFAEYGSFLGLAENVDVGNREQTDIGFVFTDKLGDRRPPRNEYIADLTALIAHEVGHLLGFEHVSHDASSSSVLADMAAEWVPQGPSPTANGQVENIPGSNPVAGAIQTVVAHPRDPNVLWIGAVNGGIWSTNNAAWPVDDKDNDNKDGPDDRGEKVIWTPRTDQHGSLSISALTLDPTDGDGDGVPYDTLVAGIGRYSNFDREGGTFIGLLRTTDGGLTWTTLAGVTGGPNVTLAGRNISGIVARGNTIVASANSFGGRFGSGGLFRSTDGGTTFREIGTTDGGITVQDLPALGGVSLGDVSDLVGDPQNPTRFYAAVLPTGGTGGLYRTEDSGLTWTNVTGAVSGSIVAVTDTIRFGIHHNAGAGTRALYVGVVSGGQLTNLWRADRGQAGFDDDMDGISDEPDDTPFQAMDLPQTNEGGAVSGLNPGGQGVANFSIVADPNNAWVVYVGGDRQPDRLLGFPNSIGAQDSTGRLFRGDARIAPTGQVPSPQWTPLTHIGAVGTAVPNGMVNGATNANPISITTPMAHGFATGDRVGITGVLGNTAANGAFTVTVINGTTFTLNGSNGNGAYTAGTGIWTRHSSDPTQSIGAAPHADSRYMIFDARNDLIEVDDGGIYRQTSPTNTFGRWLSLNSNLQVAEMHDIAYDSNTNTIIGGTQDTGTPQQTKSGRVSWNTVDLHPNFAFFSVGDGGDVAVDNTTLAGSGQSIRYSSFLSLDFFRRQVFDADGNRISQTFPALTVSGVGAALIPGPVTPVELNAINPRRLIIAGSNSIYESLNQGNTITEIGPGIPAAFLQNAIAYGGRRNGMNNPDVLYIGSNSQVFVRTAAGGVLAATMPIDGGGHGNIRDIVINPEDWMEAYVITADGMVWRTSDAGATWSDFTFDLSNVLDVRSITYFNRAGEARIAVGGNGGVFSMATRGPEPRHWMSFGDKLPNALVYDLVYSAKDGVLVAGTLGRGAWKICVDEELCRIDPGGLSLGVKTLLFGLGVLGGAGILYLLARSADGAPPPEAFALPESLEEAERSLLANLKLPFASGLDLDDSIDFSKAFLERAISQLFNVELASDFELVQLADRPAMGRLDGPSVFSLQIGDNAPVEVALSSDVMADNLSLEDLLGDLNAAFDAKLLPNGFRPTTTNNKLSDLVAATLDEEGNLVMALKATALTTTLKLIAASTDPIVRQLGFRNGQLGEELPTFEGVQDLADRLSTILAQDVEFNYDVAAKAVTMHVAFTHSINQTVPFGWDPNLQPLGTLAGLQGSGALNLIAAFGLEFDIGFDLSARSVPEGLFIEDAVLGATLSIANPVDDPIELTARLGPFRISGQGALAGETGVRIVLNNPVAGSARPTRVTLDQLLANVQTPGNLLALDQSSFGTSREPDLEAEFRVTGMDAAPFSIPASATIGIRILDLKRLFLEGPVLDGPAPTVVISLALGPVQLNLGGAILVSAQQIEFTTQSVDVDLDGGGMGAGDLFGASLVTTTLNGARAFVGIGATFNPDGTVNTSGASGFSVETADLRIAMLKPNDADIETGDGRTWTAVSGSLTNATAHGFGDLTLQLTNLQAALNQANGQSIVAGMPITAMPLNWMAQVPDAGFDLPVDVDFRVSGSMTVGVPGFVDVSGDFSLFRSQTENVLAIGASNVTSFLGIGTEPDDRIGVQITDAQLGLAIFNEPGGVKYALSAFGTATLVGADGLTMTGTLGVLYNNRQQGVNLSIPVQDDVVPLFFPDESSNPNFPDPQFAGQVEFAIDDFITLKGGFAFRRAPPQPSPAAGSEADDLAADHQQVVQTIGALNSGGFIGHGRGTPGAVGLQLSNVQVGYVLYDDGTYALRAEGTAALVGVPHVTVQNTSVRVLINTTDGPVHEVVQTNVPIFSQSGQVNVDFDSGPFKQVTADITGWDFGGYFRLSGKIGITSSSGTGGKRLLIGAKDFNLFVGDNGGTTGAQGFQVSNGTLGLVLSHLPDTPEGSFAMVAKSTLTVHGLPLPSTTEVKDLTVRINSVDLNKTGGDFIENVPVGVGTETVEVKFELAKQESGAGDLVFWQVLGDANFSVDDYVQLDGKFGLTRIPILEERTKDEPRSGTSEVLTKDATPETTTEFKLFFETGSSIINVLNYEKFVDEIKNWLSAQRNIPREVIKITAIIDGSVSYVHDDPQRDQSDASVADDHPDKHKLAENRQKRLIDLAEELSGELGITVVLQEGTTDNHRSDPRRIRNSDEAYADQNATLRITSYDYINRVTVTGVDKRRYVVTDSKYLLGARDISLFIGDLDGQLGFQLGPATFTSDQILGASSLKSKLVAHNDLVSQWLWTQLSGPTQTLLSGNPLEPVLKAALARALNKVILSDSVIYDASRFPNVTGEAATLLADHQDGTPISGTDIHRFNRLLLEGAYPAELAKYAGSEFGMVWYGKRSGYALVAKASATLLLPDPLSDILIFNASVRVSYNSIDTRDTDPETDEEIAEEVPVLRGSVTVRFNEDQWGTPDCPYRQEQGSADLEIFADTGVLSGLLVSLHLGDFITTRPQPCPPGAALPAFEQLATLAHAEAQPPTPIFALATSDLTAFVGLNRIGLQLTGGTLGLVIFSNGTYALRATGNLELAVSDFPLEMSARVSVGVNTTGRAVDVMVGGVPLQFDENTTAELSIMDLSIADFSLGGFQVAKRTDTQPEPDHIWLQLLRSDNPQAVLLEINLSTGEVNLIDAINDFGNLLNLDKLLAWGEQLLQLQLLNFKIPFIDKTPYELFNWFRPGGAVFELVRSIESRFNSLRTQTTRQAALSLADALRDIPEAAAIRDTGSPAEEAEDFVLIEEDGVGNITRVTFLLKLVVPVPIGAQINLGFGPFILQPRVSLEGVLLLGFGIDMVNDSFFVRTNFNDVPDLIINADTPEITLQGSLSLAGTATIKLGFLNFQATFPEGENHLQPTLQINLLGGTGADDGKLTVNSQVNEFIQSDLHRLVQLHRSFDARATVRLILVANDYFPSLSLDVVVAGGDFTPQIKNIRLHLGQFLEKVAMPFLDNLAKFSILQPVIDVLDDPLPLIGSSALDLLLRAAGVPETQKDVLRFLATIPEYVSDLKRATNEANAQGLTEVCLSACDPPAMPATEPNTQLLASAQSFPGQGLPLIGGDGVLKILAGLGIKFPFLDPTQLVKLLMGDETVDFVTVDLPEINIPAEVNFPEITLFSYGVPILAEVSIKAKIGGFITLTFNLGGGFDGTGLERGLEYFYDGIWLRDRAGGSGEERDEVTLKGGVYGEITGGGQVLGGYLASVKITGRVEVGGRVGIDLNDENRGGDMRIDTRDAGEKSDGKFHVNEFKMVRDSHGGGFFCAFNLDGELYALLGGSIDVSALVIFSYSTSFGKEWTLYDFTSGCESEPADLARMEGNVLVLRTTTSPFVDTRTFAGTVDSDKVQVFLTDKDNNPDTGKVLLQLEPNQLFTVQPASGGQFTVVGRGDVSWRGRGMVAGQRVSYADASGNTHWATIVDVHPPGTPAYFTAQPDDAFIPGVTTFAINSGKETLRVQKGAVAEDFGPGPEEKGNNSVADVASIVKITDRLPLDHLATQFRSETLTISPDYFYMIGSPGQGRYSSFWIYRSGDNDDDFLVRQVQVGDEISYDYDGETLRGWVTKVEDNRLTVRKLNPRDFPNMDFPGRSITIRRSAGFGTGSDTITIDPLVGADVELSGGDGDDTITTGGGRSVPSGGNFPIVLRGEGGNDQLNIVGAPDDLSDQERLRWAARLDGGEGIDQLTGGPGHDVLLGRRGNDLLDGGLGIDILVGGGGRDILHGGGGNDTLIGDFNIDLGSPANDLPSVFSPFQEGADNIYGGDGVDRIWGDNRGGVGLASNIDSQDGTQPSVGFFTGDQIYAGGGLDTVFAGAGIDLVIGDDEDPAPTSVPGADVVYGGPGDDHLYGLDENDTLIGEGGNDLITGGRGDDRLFGGNNIVGPDASGMGSDVLYGSEGNDLLDGSDSDDVYAYGGDGADTIIGSRGGDYLYGDADRDFILGGPNNDWIRGGAHDDDLIGGKGSVGDVTFPVDGFADDAADNIDGGGGNDLILGDNGAINKITRVATTIAAGGAGIDILSGGLGEDVIYGGGADDSIFGGANTDRLYGQAGSDIMTGDDGDDYLYGNEGNDIMLGDAGRVVRFPGNHTVTLFSDVRLAPGADWMSGGEGADEMYGGEFGDTLFGDEDADLIHGNDGNDTISGNDGNDNIHGGAGFDTIHGNNGTDAIFGGEADDILYGDADVDWIYGNTGSDQIWGGDANDHLFGGADNDILIGNAHDDELYGEQGDDVLVGDDLDPTRPINIGPGTVSVFGVSGRGNDTLAGGDGRDYLFGCDGDDELYGGSIYQPGSSQTFNYDSGDFLDGGMGEDVLYGDDGRVSFKPAGLSGSVWLDLNGDGIQNNSEPGFANINVRLFDSVDGISLNGNDVEISRMFTDGTGAYNFSGLNLGLYYLQFDRPAGFRFALQNQGFDDTLDSDPHPNTGRTAIFTLVSGQSDSSRDAGFTDGVTLSISDVTVSEGDAGTRQAVFTVTLSRPRNEAVTVEYLTRAGTAMPGADFGAVTSGSLTFAPNEGSKTIVVDVLSDIVDENDETFFVILSNPINAALADPVGVATISDDDFPINPDVDPTAFYIQFSAPEFTVSESDGQGNNGLVTITLVRPYSDRCEVVVFVLTNGSAIAGSDYVLARGPVDFAPGETVKTFQVTILNDSVAEPIETVNLSLRLPTGAPSARGLGTAVLNIVDDDPVQVQGHVFADLDGDGVYLPEAGDQPLPNVTVQTVDSRGVVRPAITDVQGVYTVSLALGPAFVDVDEGTIPAGSVLTTHNDPQYIIVRTTNTVVTGVGYQPGEIIITSAPEYSPGGDDTLFGGAGDDALFGLGGSDYMTGGHWLGPACACSGEPYDAQIVIGANGRPNIDPSTIPQMSFITGWVHDTDLDSVPGVKVTLFYQDKDGNEIEVATALTEANGLYSFFGITPCEYFLQFEPPPQFDLEDTDIGMPINPTNGRTNVFQLQAGDSLTVDAVLTPRTPAVFWFEQPFYVVDEAAGQVQLTVNRAAGVSFSTLVYTVTDGTATNGLDYLAPRLGVIEFAPGQTTATFTIPILRDDEPDSGETVVIALALPSGSPVPGKRGMTVLTIVQTAVCTDNDRLEGGSEDDMLLGDYGYITGGALADVVAFGSNGQGEGLSDDVYLFNADTPLGFDTVIETANGGTDTLDFSATVTAGVSIDLALETPQVVILQSATLLLSSGMVIEKLIGGGGDDILLGNSLDNVITGNAGDDRIDGRSGTDRVVESRDADFVLADGSLSVGADEQDLLLNLSVEEAELHGGSAANSFTVSDWSQKAFLYGHAGTDSVVAVRDANFTLTDTLLTITPGGTFCLDSIEHADLTAGAGVNVIDASAFTGSTTLKGEDGIDTILGSVGADTIFGGRGNDIIDGGPGADSIIWNDGDGDDVIEGGAGLDEVQVNGSALPDDFAIVANGTAFKVRRTSPTAVNLDIATVEQLVVNTAAGNDTLNAADLTGILDLAIITLDGDGDADSLYINGSSGPDQFVFDNDDAPRLRLQRTNPGQLTFSIATFETLQLSTDGANDHVIIDDLTAVASPPVITVNGGPDRDLIDASALVAGIATLSLNGDDGPDILLGSQGDDTLNGGFGDDEFILGNKGNDIIHGGNGHDRVFWNDGDGSDSIDGGSGFDQVQVTASLLPEDLTVSADSTAFRLERTNQIPFALDLEGVEAFILNAGDGNDQIRINDLSAVAALTRITIDGDGASDSLTITGSAVSDGFNLTDGLAPRLLIERSFPRSLEFDIATIESLTLNTADGDDSVTINYLFEVETPSVITVNGGSDNDTINATFFAPGLASLVLNGDDGTDTLTGSQGADTITGGRGVDTIEGLQGADLLHGGDDNDTFLWNEGDANDTINGDAGIDELRVNGTALAENFEIAANGARFNVLRTNQTLFALNGGTVEKLLLNAGGGGDTILVIDLSTVADLAAIVLEGAGGVDSLTIDGSTAAEQFSITSALARLQVHRTDSALLSFDTAAIETLVLNTGAGDDSVTISNLTGLGFPPTITVNAGPDNDTIDASALSPLLAILTLNGDDGDDTITGSQGVEAIRGGFGRDTINGKHGIDSLQGGDDNDTFVWNDGDGNDTIQGGAGVDELLLNGTAVSDNFEIAPNGTGFKVLRSNQTWFTSDSIASVEALELNAGAGEDFIAINFTGNAGLQAITINGGADSDDLNGSNLSNGTLDLTIKGGDGHDVLRSSPGNDILNGGPDNDTYRFTGNWGNDVVIEQPDGGMDTVDFSGVVAALIFDINTSITVTSGMNTLTHADDLLEEFWGGSSDDTFNVHPSARTAYFLDALDYLNDVLNFYSDGRQVDQTDFTITAAGRQTVTHSNFEVVNIDPGPGLFRLAQPAQVPAPSFNLSSAFDLFNLVDRGNAAIGFSSFLSESHRLTPGFDAHDEALLPNQSNDRKRSSRKLNRPILSAHLYAADHQNELIRSVAASAFSKFEKMNRAVWL